MDYIDCGLDGLTFTRPSLVKAQFAADCDLSNIVRKFIRSGEFPTFRERPNIGSDANYPDSFQALQDTIAFATSQFEMLPPDERAKYNNSPEVWLESHLQKGDDDESEVDQPQKEDSSDGSQDVAQAGSVTADQPTPPKA